MCVSLASTVENETVRVKRFFRTPVRGTENMKVNTFLSSRRISFVTPRILNRGKSTGGVGGRGGRLDTKKKKSGESSVLSRDICYVCSSFRQSSRRLSFTLELIPLSVLTSQRSRGLSRPLGTKSRDRHSPCVCTSKKIFQKWILIV